MSEEMGSKGLLAFWATQIRRVPLTFLQHRPYKWRGRFLDVSPCFSTNGAVLAPETWCHVMAELGLYCR